MILRNDSLLPMYEEVIWSGIGISGLSDDDLPPAFLQHSASQLPRNSPALQTDQICDSVRKSKRRMARRRALICASMVELDVHKVICAMKDPFFSLGTAKVAYVHEIAQRFSQRHGCTQPQFPRLPIFRSMFQLLFVEESYPF